MSASEEVPAILLTFSTHQNQITTRSISGRLAKKYTDSTSTHPTLNTIQSLDAEALVGGRGKRRQWEVWSPHDKKYFFEALFEHGKDFDSLESFMAQKHSRNRKEYVNNCVDSSPKTKNQIRHFYYRSWHKISPYINQSSNDETGRQVLELYSLICYGELRRRCGGKIDDKLGRKLNELVKIGSTIVKIKGKKIHIKVPYCRALKRLHNVEEIREESGKLKLPEKIRLEFVPQSNADLWHVQSTLNNPRIAIFSKLDCRLSFIFEYLDSKWRTFKDIYIEELNGYRPTNGTQLLFVVPEESSLENICITTATSLNQKTHFCYDNLITNNKDHSKIFQLNSSPPPIAKRVKNKSDDISTTKIIKNTETFINKQIDSVITNIFDNKNAIELNSYGKTRKIVSVKENNEDDILNTNHSLNIDYNLLEKNNCGSTNSKLNDCAKYQQLDENNEKNISELVTNINTSDSFSDKIVKNNVELDEVTTKINLKSIESNNFVNTIADISAQTADHMNISFSPTNTIVGEAGNILNEMDSSHKSIEEKLLETRTIDYNLSKQLTVAQLYLMMGAQDSLRLEYKWLSSKHPSSSAEKNTTRLIESAEIGFTNSNTKFNNLNYDSETFLIKPSLKCLLQLASSEFASLGQDSSMAHNKTTNSANNINNRTGSTSNPTINPNKRRRRSPPDSNPYSDSLLGNQLASDTWGMDSEFRSPMPPKNTRIIADKDMLKRMPLLQSLTDASSQKQRHKVQRRSIITERGWADSIDSLDAKTGSNGYLVSNANANMDGKTLITMEPSEMFKSTTAIRRIIPITLPPIQNNSLINNLSVNNPQSNKIRSNILSLNSGAITGVDAFLTQSQASRESMDSSANILQGTQSNLIRSNMDDSITSNLFDVNNLSLPSILDNSMCEDASSGAVDRIIDIALDNSASERHSFSNFKIGRFLGKVSEDSNGIN